MRASSLTIRSAHLRHRLSVLLTVLVLAGCGRNESGPVHAVASPADAPVDGGRLARRLENDIQTLNAVLQTTDYDRSVLSYIHDPLIDLDENLQPIPGTAAKWEIADGGRTYIFHLDPRATFSDGQPVRASDVLFTLRKIIDEQSPEFSSLFDLFDRTKSAVVDDRTVRVAFREARPAQLMAFNIAILPEHVYGKGDFKKDFNDSAVGDGPYKLVTWDRGKSVLLQRRANYWREKPHIDSILFKVLSDDNVAWLSVKRGELDEMRVKSDRWATEKDRPDVRQKVNFYNIYLLSYNCIAWNNADPLLKDARVRNALAMAYDRDAIIRNLYRDQARAITGPAAPDQWAYDPSVPPIHFDLTRAAALLKDAGWSDTDGDGVLDRQGRKFEFDMLLPAGSQVAMEQTQVFQQALQKIGVRMNIRPLDGASMFRNVMSGKYQSAFMAWSLDPDPDLYPLFDSKQKPPAGLNVVRYANPEVDALIAQTRREFNFNQRRELFHRLHQILARDQPYLWTVQVAMKWAVNKRVNNVHIAKGFGLYNWYPGSRAWWLSPSR